MSVANGRNQDKRNLSIGRGRGKRSSQQKPTAAIQNDTHESKSESQSKVPDKAPSTRVSRGRGWKRPDQAIYIPKALRKDNPKDSNDRKVTEDANKQKGEDEVCRLKKEYDSIFSDSDSFLQQKGTNRQSLTRQYPEEEETAVSVASTEDQKNCDSLVEKGTEIPENISAKSSIENNLSNNEAASLDMNKPFNKSVIHEDCQEKKNISEKTKDEEEEREKVLRTEENTCGRLHVESIKKGKEEKLWKNESKIEIESASLDMCQSMSPVTSCVESDKEQEGQKLLEYQERRESTKLGQEKSVVDMCQSSSTVESVNVEVNTKDEKEVLLQVQEMQENIIRTEQQEYATTTKTTSSLELDLTIIEGEAEQKKKDDFLEKNELVAIENKREDQQTQRTEACQSSLTDTCQSITDAEVNNEIHNKHDINPQEGMHTTSLEQELKAAFDTGYEMDATNVEECLPKGSSKHDFNNVLMDLKDFNTDEVQIEDKTVCFKNEVINDQSSDTDKEVTSDTKDRIKKEEIPSQNTEGQKESQDFKIMEVQESTESDHVNNSSSVDLGNEEKEKMDADDVVNNEKKNDEKESKHKKKSKKKKEEKDSKEEKKKKKSKKKESEDGDGDGDGEPKEKENDEKRKLKKKEKKKASKEDAGTKCKESKSKEKAKDKKEKECKTGNEGNDDDAVDDDESWESKFNEDGECLDPELLEEVMNGGRGRGK